MNSRTQNCHRRPGPLSHVQTNVRFLAVIPRSRPAEQYSIAEIMVAISDYTSYIAHATVNTRPNSALQLSRSTRATTQEFQLFYPFLGALFRERNVRVLGSTVTFLRTLLGAALPLA